MGGLLGQNQQENDGCLIPDANGTLNPAGTEMDFSQPDQAGTEPTRKQAHTADTFNLAMGNWANMCLTNGSG